MLSFRNKISYVNAEDCGFCESYALSIENNYLYSAARIGFDVFKINSNGSLSYVNSYYSTDYYGSSAIHVKNNLLIARTTIHNSQIFNISDPLNITFISNISYGYDYFIQNNLLFSCNYGGLDIYDISIPKKPILLYTIIAYKGEIIKAFAEGELLYLIYDGVIYQDPFFVEYHAFAIYDISRPHRPLFITLEEDLFKGPLYEVFVREGNIYLTGEKGIYYCFYDNSKLNFKLLQHGFPFAQIAVKDVFLFIGSDPIYVYDILDPHDPIFLSSFQGNSLMRDLTVSGGILYSANGEDGIGLIEILSKYTSRISILFGPDLSFICVGFTFAMMLVILLNRKLGKKFTISILSH